MFFSPIFAYQERKSAIIDHQNIAITRDLRWIKTIAVLLLFPGVFALIPFKVSYLQMFDLPFYLSGILGALLLFRGTQKIGWRLSLEGNILYYSKFNVYSSWKTRRRTEFALPLSKVVSAEKLKAELKIMYNPSKKLVFSIRGLDSLQHRRLDKIIVGLNNQELK